VRRTQKGQELSEQLRKVFMKHRYRAIAARKANEQKERITENKEIPVKSPVKSQEIVMQNSPAREERPKEKPKRRGS
jgi:hypothetical protein